MHHPDQDYADEGITIPKPGLKLGIKSQQQMLMPSELMKFYVTKNRDLSIDNVRWNPIIINFKNQWKSLEKKAKVTADYPKVTKKFSMMKWSDSMTDHLSLRIGLRMMPLGYVVRYMVP